MTNWISFEKYLKENIISPSTTSGKEMKHVLKEEFKSKYTLESDVIGELEIVLTELLDSIKNNKNKGFISNNKYYELPDLTYTDSNSGTTLKDLEQAFPEKEKTRFGLKKNGRDSDMKTETWKALEQIYEDWCTEQTRPFRLKREVKDFTNNWRTNSKEMAYIQIIKDDKNIKKKLEEWLREYQELTSDEKEELKKERSIVQEDLDLINSIPPHKLLKNDNTDNINTSYVSWLKQHWKGAVVCSAAGTILVLFLIWVYKKVTS